jgi:hypothetical protein
LLAQSPGSGWFWGLWTVVAAFGTYFCMYAFRKPFTAATYDDLYWAGITFKTVLVTSQTLGYMLSKFIGIKVVAEMPPHRRALGILVLIGLAQLALLGFGLTPHPWNAIFLFFNGLPLGMVFGLVLGFLEGRRATEALTAGLCTSFILADGVTKSVGAWLLNQQVAEFWMPAVAGFMFAGPLLLFVGMLAIVPPPNSLDIAERAERGAMTRADRRQLYWRYFTGLTAIVVLYLLISILRSIRSDFAAEIWFDMLQTKAAPAAFSISEVLVALGVMLANGAVVFVRHNRIAFFASLGVCAGGLGLIIAALLGWQNGQVSPFWFMVLMGLGLYLPYVAMHTTVFERFLAMTRERGNLGFLMYVADSIGYLGVVGVLLARNWFQVSGNFVQFFVFTSWVAVGFSVLCLALSWSYFIRRTTTLPNPAPNPVPNPAHVPANEGTA